MIWKKFSFLFAFNLRKRNITDFSFISLTQNFVLCLQIITARQPINGRLSENGLPSVPVASASNSR